jgi:di- and tripeptidase
LDESLKDLVMLLSTLTGKNGEVKIPGFYDPVLPLGGEERELYDDITAALVQRNPDLGDPEVLKISLMRRWREASLTIHRFQTSGPENATIIPRLARAAISMRLVPNQEAGKVAQSLVSYLRSEFSKLESNNKLTITIDHQAEPWLGDWTNEIFRTLEEAIVDAWGPIDQTRRRRSSVVASNGLNVQATSPGQVTMNGGYFTTKPSPTTSNVLASGSADVPDVSPLTPLEEVTEKLEDMSPSSLSSKRGSKHRRKSSKNATSASISSTQRRKPLYIREGGSIPAIRFLEKEFDAPAAHFPCGQASDAAHLDNERLRLVNLFKGREVFKKVFRELPCK